MPETRNNTPPPATGMRKRQQITKANRSMFLWVAGASVVVAFAIVLGQFMLQQAIFNERVLAEKSTTNRTLEDNIEAADELKEEVNHLLADDNLAAARADATDSNLQVVLDALPTRPDSLNLGSSLQLVLLSGRVQSIDSLTVDTVGGDEETGVEDASVEIIDTGPNELTFRFTVSGNYENIMDVLRALSRSIRPIDVTAINVQGNDEQLAATIDARTFYQNAKAVELQEKTVTP